MNDQIKFDKVQKHMELGKIGWLIMDDFCLTYLHQLIKLLKRAFLKELIMCIIYFHMAI